MSARLAAGWALVCTLFLGGGLARAEDPLVDAVVPRRPVAVIDLSDQERVGKLAKEILVELNNRDDLKQLNQPPLQTALIEVTVAVGVA